MKVDYICLIHLKNEASKNLVKNRSRFLTVETPHGELKIRTSAKNGETHLYAGYLGPKFSYQFQLNGKPITEKELKNL